MIELHGLTMGVVGYGRIGRNSASVAKAFGMKIWRMMSSSQTRAIQKLRWWISERCCSAAMS